jgi:hypothetical protein
LSRAEQTSAAPTARRAGREVGAPQQDDGSLPGIDSLIEATLLCRGEQK